MSDYIANAAGISTRWLTEEVFKLIELVQRDEAIYNPRHKYYFCRPYVENFWREVDQKLDKNPGASLAKWTNLRISFRREFTNYLEEKVAPCWSYFDRMFFLHPYLRKKQQQTTTKPGETLQEALAQIGELSNRLERQAADKANKPGTQTENANSLQQQHSNVDNYFDYYDEPEPNNSELDEIVEDEQQQQRHESARYPQVILETPGLSQHQIKSENEDELAEDDYEIRREILLDADSGAGGEDNVATIRLNSPPLLNNNIGRLTKRSHSSQQQQIRLEHLNRLQTRSYHEDLRAKRPRSQERMPVSNSNLNASSSQRNSSSSTSSIHATSNVSFVRPTVAKSNDANSVLDASVSSAMVANLQNSAATLNSTFSTLSTQSTARYYNQRLDANSSNNALPAYVTNPSSSSNLINAQSSRQNLSPSAGTTAASAPTPHVELCDCKSDPDAMFLMSLLPDIQKLNGRDRGKIKIAFQNILQDYLYPD